jgi:hypothetical protein
MQNAAMHEDSLSIRARKVQGVRRMTTRTVRTGGLAAPLALLFSVPAAACHVGGSAPPSVASPRGDVAFSPLTIAPALRSSAETPAQGVATADALLDAAQTLELTETQQEKVRALKDHLAKYEQNARVAFRALREDVADQVRAGAIVMVSVAADEDRAAGALTVRVDEGAETMNALYATLSPSQRAGVVAVVRAKQPDPPGATRPPATLPPYRLARLTSDLALDREQKRRVSALLEQQPAVIPALEEPRGPTDAILDGFGGSTFDAWTAVPPPLAPPAEAFRRSIDRELGFVANVVPILRPAQRDVLASIIEARIGLLSPRGD